MRVPYVFNIQKFSLHDGPGIRTTVFFKGCPLRCLWCHNPEGQSYSPEIMRDRKEERIGRRYPVEELLGILLADQIFYEQSGGGVTFSGGEVMTQDMDYVEALARGLRDAGVSLAADTSGFAPAGSFLRLLPYAGLFLYDLKLMDPVRHEQYTGAPNALILDNLRLLGERGARVELRLMLAGGVNDDPASIGEVIGWLGENRIAPEQVSLLPYHDFGRDKYGKLGRACTQAFAPPADETIAEIKARLERAGYAVKVGG